MSQPHLHATDEYTAEAELNAVVGNRFAMALGKAQMDAIAAQARADMAARDAAGWQGEAARLQGELDALAAPKAPAKPRSRR